MKLFYVNWHTIYAAEKAIDAVTAYRRQGLRTLIKLKGKGITRPRPMNEPVEVHEMSEKDIARLTVNGKPIMKFAQEHVQRVKKYPCAIAWRDPEEEDK